MRHALMTSLSLLAFGILSGCTNDGSSLFIIDVKSLDDECVVSDVALVNGTVDVTLTRSLTLYPTFASQVRDRVSPIAANPNDMHVYAVDVELRAVDGTTISVGGSSTYRVPTSVFIDGYSGAGNPSTASGAVEVLPPDYPAEVLNVVTDGGTVMIAMKPIGRTNGGTDVEGNFDFVYPVRVCAGCLSRCAVGDEETQNPCFPGQNELEVVPCAP